jgi:hypothetical protein
VDLEDKMDAGKFGIEILTSDTEREGLPQDFLYHRGSPNFFVNIGSLTIPPTWTKFADIPYYEFRKWLHGFISTGTLQKTSTHDMDDLRIRPFTAVEVLAVREFLVAGLERAKAHTLLEVGAFEFKSVRYLHSPRACRK